MTTIKPTPSEPTGQSLTRRCTCGHTSWCDCGPPIEHVCAICRIRFASAWTDEEAKEELNKKFGETSLEDCEVVCDECYKKLMEKKDDV